MRLNGVYRILKGVGGNMKNRPELANYLIAAALCLFAFSYDAHADSKTGEAEFKEYCAGCHFDGGNLISPTKTLSKVDREKNGVKTIKDIIKIMRKPGEDMSTFDEKTLPESEATKIAEYILKTF